MPSPSPSPVAAAAAARRELQDAHALAGASEAPSTSSEAEDEEAYEAYELAGGLKSRFLWDGKHLSVGLRQSVQTSRRMEIKLGGQLNTSTGQHSWRGHLRKYFHSNTPSLQRVLAAAQLNVRRQAGLASKEESASVRRQLAQLDINPDRLLPAGFKPLLLQDWVVAPGLVCNPAANSGSRPRVKGLLTIKKMPQALLHSPRTDLFLTGKAQAEVDGHTGKVDGLAAVRLKLFKYSVTKEQDLQVSVGWDMATTALSFAASSSGEQQWTNSPYLKVGDNSVSCKLQGRRWLLMYEP